MTEKRFYYNTFYHADDMSRVLEYEIIDRQSYPNYPNHDEKEDIPQWYIYISENDSGWQDMLVDLLNEQDQKIQQSKDAFYEAHKQQQDCLNEVLKLREEKREIEFQLNTLKKWYTCRNCAFHDKEMRYLKSLRK